MARVRGGVVMEFTDELWRLDMYYCYLDTPIGDTRRDGPTTHVNQIVEQA